MIIVNIPHKLYPFDELSEEGQSLAIDEHKSFLEDLGDAGIIADDLVKDSIQANGYFFYESGELASTTTYTEDNHPTKTVYNHGGKEYLLIDHLNESEDDAEIKYENHYKCENCNIEWEDRWDSMCDDECPECGIAISPYNSIELDEEQ